MYERLSNNQTKYVGQCITSLCNNKNLQISPLWIFVIMLCFSKLTNRPKYKVVVGLTVLM